MTLGKPDRKGANAGVLGSADGNQFSHWPNATKDGIEAIAVEVEGRISGLFGFRIDINLVAALAIPSSKGKAKRVMDERQEQEGPPMAVFQKEC